MRRSSSWALRAKEAGERHGSPALERTPRLTRPDPSGERVARVLSDPKKLRTRRGHGYLVSWRDRMRCEDVEAAEALAERLLDETGNLDALRGALGRPDASRDEVADWLAGALAAGSMVAVRTRRKPPVFDAPPEVDLRDLVGPTPDEQRPEETTWLEIRLVDEVGAALPGVAVRMRAGEETVVDTNGEGVARLEGATTSFGTAVVADSSALHELLRERWSTGRDDPWIYVDGDPQCSVASAVTPLPSIPLEAKTPHTLVIQPRVGRARVVGSVFDTNKAFVLPDALGLLKEVTALYGEHPGAVMLIVGHTDTTGEPDLNDALSLARARAVAAYLQDDVDAWLAFYDDGVSASARWGAPEDALLLERALWGLGQPAAADPVRVYQEARGLSVDGDLGPNTRRALIEDYMALDGSTLPASITPQVHGCGESYPLADDAETLDVDPPDGVEDPTDRRVEVFFFDPPFGVLPAAASDLSTPRDPEYPIWCRRARYTKDMLVVRPRMLAVRVLDAASGAPLPGASVDVPGTQLAGTSDTFGVVTFMAVAAGVHQVHAASEGYLSGSVQHAVLDNAAATVASVELQPLAVVRVVLSLRGPDDVAIPLPAGVLFTLEHEAGAVEADSDPTGTVVLDAPSTQGSAVLSLSLGERCCLVQHPSGQSELVALEDALTHADAGSRFVQLPSELRLPDARLVLDSRVDSGPDGAELSSLISLSRDGEVLLELVPVWEHVCFTFHDRHYKRRRFVPGPAKEGQPTLVMTGHLDGSSDAQFASAWPFDRDSRTVHSLAWFLEHGGVPTEADRIRMRCPERTYAVSSREDPATLSLEVTPPTDARVDAPNPDRLLYYDLPQRWECDRYYGRRTTDAPGPRPYLELARQTSASSPIVVSLDDIVVMERRGTSRRGVVEIEGEVSILDNDLSVYKPNETGAGGYGEPYFTDKARLVAPPGQDGVPAWLLLDTPAFARAIVYRRIFDVFEQRTNASDRDVPIGARVAFAPGEFETGASSPFTHHATPLRLPMPGKNGEVSGSGASGRADTVLLRCCGSESGETEVMATLQVFRVHFDFFPTTDPPRGASSLVGRSQENVVRENGPWIVAQALDRAAARWNGTEHVSARSQLLDPVSGDKVNASPARSTRTVSSLFGGKPSAPSYICHHRVLFQRHDAPPASGGKPSELHIRLWLELRSSMAGQGASNWDYADLAAHHERSTTAHELGHALGLPDEYGETVKHASLGCLGFVDEFVPEGRPYVHDVNDTDDGAPADKRPIGKQPPNSAMMTHNGVVRARHMLPIAQWAKAQGKLPECLSIRAEGEHLGDPAGLPESPYEPLVRRYNVSVGGGSLFDAFLYRVGEGSHIGRRFGRGGEGVDALLILRLRVEIRSHADYLRAAKFADRLRLVFHRLSKKILETVAISGPGGPLNAALVLSPRVLWREYPKFKGDKKQLGAFRKFLGGLSYAGNTVPPPPSKEELEQALEEIREQQEQRRVRLEGYETASPRPPEVVIEDLEQKIENGRGEEEAAEAELAAFVEGDPPQDASRDAYLELTEAIAGEHPPHVVVHTRTAFRVDLLDQVATPREAECPVDLDTPGIRLRFQALCAQLLGAKEGRSRSSEDERRVLVAKVLEGTEFGVME